MIGAARTDPAKLHPASRAIERLREAFSANLLKGCSIGITNSPASRPSRGDRLLWRDAIAQHSGLLCITASDRETAEILVQLIDELHRLKAAAEEARAVRPKPASAEAKGRAKTKGAKAA